MLCRSVKAISTKTITYVETESRILVVLIDYQFGVETVKMSWAQRQGILVVRRQGISAELSIWYPNWIRK